MKEKWQKLPMYGKVAIITALAVGIYFVAKKVMKKKA